MKTTTAVRSGTPKLPGLSDFRDEKEAVAAEAVKGILMKRICAWCKKDLDPSISSENVTVTHGICIPCANKLILKEKLRLQSLVDRLELLRE